MAASLQRGLTLRSGRRPRLEGSAPDSVLVPSLRLPQAMPFETAAARPPQDEAVAGSPAKLAQIPRPSRQMLRAVPGFASFQLIQSLSGMKLPSSTPISRAIRALSLAFMVAMRSRFRSKS